MDEPPICPNCQTLEWEGKAVPPVEATCPVCFHRFQASVAHAGERIQCPQCTHPVLIPEPEAALIPAPPRSIRDYGYLALALALIPLGLSAFARPNDLEERIQRTRIDNPIPFQASTTEVELFQNLPGQRIEGALLPRFTWLHWLFALASASAYLGLFMLVFGRTFSSPATVIRIGLFTGTIGILVLLGVQLVADLAQHVDLVGGGIVVVLFYIAKVIGFSYRAALHPESGFFLSFFGFTIGVGLCEELCKALPILYSFRFKGTLTWRSAYLWGLASGAGFGVSEGITYASEFYNGLATTSVYVVRFVSCVALHAVWSASAAITACRHQRLLQGKLKWIDWPYPLLRILTAAMILHGLYDTLVKQEQNVLALLVSLISFGWLAAQIEGMRRSKKNRSSGAPYDAEAPHEELG